MSKDKLQLLSPLFLKYQTEYEKNPRSRVFAPLAETYRKLGMTEKAMEILSQGIRFHPTYVMGYLGLSFCYFDIKQYNLAYSTLRPLVEGNRDNIRLQKLFADICLKLNQKEEALETFKYLLFINPRDKEVAYQVTTLENIIEQQYKPSHKPIFLPEETFHNKNNHFAKVESNLFDIDKLDSRPHSEQKDFDDWMALDLSKDSAQITKEDQYDFWNLKKGSEKTKTEPPAISQTNNERKFQVKLDLDNDDQEDEADLFENQEEAAPLVTHTLVDLYCGQGHIEKALEVLEKILILNPHDKKTISKIAEIKTLMGVEDDMEESHSSALAFEMPASDKILTSPDVSPVSEEEGRLHLMNLIDETIGTESTETDELPIDKASNEKIIMIENKLTLFLQRIHKRALDYQSRL